jgi:hypothetical protein
MLATTTTTTTTKNKKQKKKKERKKNKTLNGARLFHMLCHSVSGEEED